MEEPARYLLFHGTVILLLALVAGIPYGKSITNKAPENIIFAWRVVHSSLTIGAILLFSLSGILGVLDTSLGIKWPITVLYIISAYAFSFALYLAAITGHRGLSNQGSRTARLVYFGNLIGSATSLLGTLLLLFVAWKTL